MPYAKTALVLLIAFALPGAAEALGLGEIHVDSALNEPLAAEVEIVGATAEDLAGIAASIANPETFLRFGVDRPAFLSTSTFRVAMDSKGRPILAIRSTGSFTEPLINMLIDLRWHGGELIREYTLLLDPPKFPSDTALAEAAPTDGGASTRPTPAPASGPGAIAVPAAPVVTNAHAAPAAPEPLLEASQPASHVAPGQEETRADVVDARETVKVLPGATLRGIASRIGDRGDAGLERLMIAIFRANPDAFEGNINRLRVGSDLTIPSIPEISKISADDASGEFRQQMEAWHAPTGFASAAKPIETVAASPAIHASSETVTAADAAALDRRIQVLEQGLSELQTALRREQDTLADLQARMALADKARAATVPSPAASVPVPAAIVSVPATVPMPATVPVPAVKSGRTLLASIAAVLLLVGGVFGALYKWRRRPASHHAVSPTYASAQDVGPAQIVARPAPSEPAISAAPYPAGGGVLKTLHEEGGFKERRTSLVDALKVAVKREPNRRDLRLKLLETYYAAAATSRQGFLEIAQSFASERKSMTDGEWGKIIVMGRQIAADNDLFASDAAPAEGKLATCA